MRFTTKKLVTLALLSAMAYAVTFVFNLLNIALIPGYNFPILDLKDVIIIIGGFIYGPLAALLMSLVVSFIEWFTISKTGHWGFVMNVLATCSFVLPAAFIYKLKKKIAWAVVGLIAGVAVMVPVMLLANYIITPLYMPVSREAVAELLLPLFLPFNLAKGGINAAIAIMLYNPVKIIFARVGADDPVRPKN